MIKLPARWKHDSWYVMKSPNRGGVPQDKQTKFSGIRSVPFLFRVSELDSRGVVREIAYYKNGSDVDHKFRGYVEGFGERHGVFQPEEAQYFREASVSKVPAFRINHDYKTRDGSLIDILSRMRHRMTGKAAFRNAIRGNGNRLTITSVKVDTEGNLTQFVALLKDADGFVKTHRTIRIRIAASMAKLFDEFDNGEKTFVDVPNDPLMTNDCELDQQIGELFDMLDDEKPKKLKSVKAKAKDVIEEIEKTLAQDAEQKLAMRLLNAVRVLITCKDERDALRYHTDGYVKGVDSIETLIGFAAARKDWVLRDTEISAETYRKSLEEIQKKKEELEAFVI